MITPIRLNSIIQQRQNKINSAQSKPNFSFCSRPEYDYFEKNYEIRASNYFRRGQCYGSPSEKFKDVIDSIKLTFSINDKPKILIAGVGEAQEPFSFLSVIKDIKNNKPLKDAVDLNCVDLQPKITDEALKKYSYMDSFEPIFAHSSFDYIQNPEYKPYFHYKVKPEMFEYLKEVFNNPEKTKWDTTIEEFSAVCPEKTYDMISINNVLGYIVDDMERVKAMDNLSKMLKKGGILITEVYDDFYKQTFPCLNGFKNLNPGIWQKLV